MHKQFFDTIRILPNNKWKIEAKNEKMNFREFKDGSVGISLDESTTEKDILKICKIFSFIQLFKLLDPKIYNLSRVKLNFLKSKFIVLHLPAAIVFFGLVYLIIPTFYKYEKSDIKNLLCKEKDIECLILGKINYNFSIKLFFQCN